MYLVRYYVTDVFNILRTLCKLINYVWKYKRNVPIMANTLYAILQQTIIKLKTIIELYIYISYRGSTVFNM